MLLSLDSGWTRIERFGVNQNPRDAMLGGFRTTVVVPAQAIIKVGAGDNVAAASFLATENVHKVRHSRGDRIRTCGLLLPKQAL